VGRRGRCWRRRESSSAWIETWRDSWRETVRPTLSGGLRAERYLLKKILETHNPLTRSNAKSAGQRPLQVSVARVSFLAGRSLDEGGPSWGVDRTLCSERLAVFPTPGSILKNACDFFAPF
jgi:hypothetical protein